MPSVTHGKGTGVITDREAWQKVLLGNGSRAKRKLVELDALQTKKIKLSHLVTCEMTSSALQDRLEVKQVWSKPGGIAGKNKLLGKDQVKPSPQLKHGSGILRQRLSS